MIPYLYKKRLSLHNVIMVIKLVLDKDKKIKITATTIRCF